MAGSFNRERAARVLAEATLVGDTKAAARFGVSASTVRTWWKRLDKDEDLARLYAEHVAKLDGDWIGEVQSALQAVVRRIREEVERNDDNLSLHDLLSAARTLGELVVAHHALVIDEPPPREGRQAATSAAGSREASTAIH